MQAPVLFMPFWDFYIISVATLIMVIFRQQQNKCVAPLVVNSLQSGRYGVRSTASVHDRLRKSTQQCLWENTYTHTSCHFRLGQAYKEWFF